MVIYVQSYHVLVTMSKDVKAFYTLLKDPTLNPMTWPIYPISLGLAPSNFMADLIDVENPLWM